jgi:CRP-like cAMP-binding protein
MSLREWDHGASEVASSSVATVDDLANIPLFDSISESDLEELANWFDVQTVGDGAKLTIEGADGYSFYVLIEGTAVVTAEDATVANYAPGDFFGEMAILGGTRRNATVTTTSPARLLFMFGTEFRRLEQAQPAIAARLEEVMRQRQEELVKLRQGASEQS